MSCSECKNTKKSKGAYSAMWGVFALMAEEFGYSKEEFVHDAQKASEIWDIAHHEVDAAD